MTVKKTNKKRQSVVVTETIKRIIRVKLNRHEEPWKIGVNIDFSNEECLEHGESSDNHISIETPCGEGVTFTKKDLKSMLEVLNKLVNE